MDNANAFTGTALTRTMSDALKCAAQILGYQVEEMYVSTDFRDRFEIKLKTNGEDQACIFKFVLEVEKWGYCIPEIHVRTNTHFYIKMELGSLRKLSVTHLKRYCRHSKKFHLFKI